MRISRHLVIFALLRLCVVTNSQLPAIPIPALPFTIPNFTQEAATGAFDGLDANSPIFSNAAIASLFDAAERPAAPEPNAGARRAVLTYYDTSNFGGHVWSQFRASLSLDWMRDQFEPFSWRFSPQAFSLRMVFKILVPADVRLTFVARAGGPVAVYLNEESGRSKIVVDGWNIDTSASAPINFDGISASRRFVKGKASHLEKGKLYTIMVIHSTEESLIIDGNSCRMLQVAMQNENSNEITPIPLEWLQIVRDREWGGGGGIYASFYGAVKNREEGLQSPSYSTIIQPTFSSPNIMWAPGANMQETLYSARLSASLLPEERATVKLVVVSAQGKSMPYLLPRLWVNRREVSLLEVPDHSFCAQSEAEATCTRARAVSSEVLMEPGVPMQVDVEVYNQLAEVYDAELLMPFLIPSFPASPPPNPAGDVVLLSFSVYNLTTLDLKARSSGYFGAKYENSSLSRLLYLDESASLYMPDQSRSQSAGCGPSSENFWFSSNVTGMVVLLERGSCYFYQKALASQQAGAVAVIFFDHVEYRQPMILVPPSLAPSQISIPVFTMARQDALALSSASWAGAAYLKHVTPIDTSIALPFLLLAKKDEEGKYGEAGLIPTRLLSPTGLGGFFSTFYSMQSGYNQSMIQPMISFDSNSPAYIQTGGSSFLVSNDIFAEFGAYLVPPSSQEYEFLFNGDGFFEVWIDNILVMWKNDRFGEQKNLNSKLFLEKDVPIPVEVRIYFKAYELKKNLLANLMWRAGLSSCESSLCSFQSIPQRFLLPIPCIAGRQLVQYDANFPQLFSTSCVCPLDRQVAGERHCADIRGSSCSISVFHASPCEMNFDRMRYLPELNGTPPCLILKEDEILWLNLSISCRFDDAPTLPAGSAAPVGRVGEEYERFKYSVYMEDGSFASSFEVKMYLEVTAFDFFHLGNFSRIIEDRLVDEQVLAQGKLLLRQHLRDHDLGPDFFAGGRLYTEASLRQKLPIRSLVLRRNVPLVADLSVEARALIFSRPWISWSTAGLIAGFVFLGFLLLWRYRATKRVKV
eukprot:768568-Hanusia_phi.AAC.3